MKVILATGNKGKVTEFEDLLSPLHWKVMPQSQFSVPECEETGLTFVENAILKARNAAKSTGLPALGDDSGLIVESLQGAPGLYSARYAGANATGEENIQKLLFELKSVPETQRSAHFYCVLVYLRYAEDPVPIIGQGWWKGTILLNPQGEKGFGYDPIFFDPKHNCSAAELPAFLKNQISHRGKAVQDLIKQFT